MSSNEDRAHAAADHTASEGGQDGTVDSGTRDSVKGSQTPRLMVSWLIVGVPLAYGIYQTISKTLPLFGG